jgi:hypothetical protein
MIDLNSSGNFWDVWVISFDDGYDWFGLTTSECILRETRCILLELLEEGTSYNWFSIAMLLSNFGWEPRRTRELVYLFI